MSSDATLRTAHGEDVTLSMHGGYADLMTTQPGRIGEVGLAHLTPPEAIRIALALLAWAQEGVVTTMDFD